MNPTEQKVCSALEEALKYFHVNPDVSLIFPEVVVRYNEPHRHHHTLEHVAEGLDEIDLFKESIKDDNLVFGKRNRELAFHKMRTAFVVHDIVYNPYFRGNNERLSAYYGKYTLLNFGVQDCIASEVHDMVLSTDSKILPVSIEEMIIHDCDYSILGKPKERFARYEEGIQAEVNLIPFEEYKKHRLGFLNKTLESPIFYTEFFRNRYEDTARDNIRGLIAKLEMKPKIILL
jgi:predicted metal-dependent HD superfamily phosphohydrolase